MNTVLFILMRNDLDSMNEGKAIAQGSHATSDFKAECRGILIAEDGKGRPDAPGYLEWKNSGGNFGTVIVLEGSMHDIKNAVSKCRDKGYYAGITHDKSYPIKDGKVMHHIPLDTCGWVFVPNRLEFNLLDNLKLHR